MEDTFNEAPLTLPSTKKGPNKKNMMSMVSFQSDSSRRSKTNTDLLRKDILEKDQQISNLQSQIEQLDETYELVHKLIKDLEKSSSTSILNYTQNSKFKSVIPHEAVGLIRTGMKTLVTLHNELPQRFENDFIQKVNQITDEIEETDRQIIITNTKRLEIEKMNQQFERTAYIEEMEKQSLAMIVENLKKQIDDNENYRQVETMEINDQIDKLKKQIKVSKQEKSMKTKKNIEQRAIATAPISKRTKDTIMDDVELQKEIAKLQQQLEREYSEHSLDQEELIHTENEIERAKEVMMKFKRSHSKEEKVHAITVNKNLRYFIEKQREDSKWAIKNQIKKNKELEKQRVELVEEEEMLSNYLQLVEKKLAAQMLKLPTLAMIQHRTEETPKRRVNTTTKKKREPDDAEMRTIKRQMTKLQKERARSRTAMP